jgi:type IV pilus assembly protein PilX
MKNYFPNATFQFKRERGAVLFVALVFLVLLTLLGLTASSTSILQERMTGGLHNNQLAFMGAETALRGVEWSIWNASNTGNKFQCGATGGNSFCYQANNANATGQTLMSSSVTAFRNAKNWLNISSDGGGAYATTTLTGLSSTQASASLANQPRYIMEDLGVVLPPGANSNGQGGGRDNLPGRGAQGQQLHAYRITARASGGNAGSIRAIDSYFVALPPSL